MCLSIYLSLRLSQVSLLLKWLNRISQTMLHNSQGSPVFSCQRSGQNSFGVILNANSRLKNILVAWHRQCMCVCVTSLSPGDMRGVSSRVVHRSPLQMSTLLQLQSLSRLLLARPHVRQPSEWPWRQGVLVLCENHSTTLFCSDCYSPLCMGGCCALPSACLSVRLLSLTACRNVTKLFVLFTCCCSVASSYDSVISCVYVWCE